MLLRIGSISALAIFAGNIYLMVSGCTNRENSVGSRRRYVVLMTCHELMKRVSIRNRLRRKGDRLPWRRTDFAYYYVSTSRNVITDDAALLRKNLLKSWSEWKTCQLLQGIDAVMVPATIK